MLQYPLTFSKTTHKKEHKNENSTKRTLASFYLAKQEKITPCDHQKKKKISNLELILFNINSTCLRLSFTIAAGIPTS